MNQPIVTLGRSISPLVAAVLCWAVAAADATAQTFIVNSPADVVGASPGNHLCETAPGNGVCTLRRAIIEANHWPGGGATVDLRSLPGGAATLTIPASGPDDETTGDLDVLVNMTIIGAGPGANVVYGNGGVIHDRVFHIAGPLTTVVTITGVTIRDGVGSGATVGCGIRNDGILTLSNVEVTNNTCNDPSLEGSIYSSGNLVVRYSVVHDNDGGQAAISSPANGGILTIVNSTIRHNSVRGVACDNCDLTLDATWVAENHSSPLGYGGGVVVTGAAGFATIERSTISANDAWKGGGVANIEATVLVVNSTISGNSSRDEGGGIFNYLGAATRIYNATITLNQADSDFDGFGAGGGVSNGSGAVSFLNTILAGNSETFFFNGLVFPVTGECNGTIVSIGYNLMEDYDTSHCTVSGSGVTLADPVLGPLQNNGGPTATHALLAGSPAIDAGDVGGCTDDSGAPLHSDQRSYPRPAPSGGRCDIGAFEVGSSGFTDDPLIPGSTPVKAAHVTQLRSRIDAQRTRFGLPAFAWTDAGLAAGATIKAVHVLELRTALTQAYQAAFRDAPAFTDATLVAASTPIRAVHLTELRDAVLNLEND